MKSRRLFFTAAMFCLMAGCAAVPPPKKVNLSDTCYSSLSALPALPLSPQSEEALKKLRPQDYASLAKCFQDKDGKRTPVAFYKLVGTSVPSVVKATMTSSRYGVMAAKVTLLDQNFNEISHAGFDKFLNRGNTYTVDVFINSDAVKYLAIGPDDQQVGKSEKQYSSISNAAVIPAGPVFFVYTSGKDSVQERAFTDVGSLLVTVKTASSTLIETRK